MRVMPIRVFLRGGYQTLTEPTLISKHGVPVFTVFPPIATLREAKIAASISHQYDEAEWESLPKVQIPTIGDEN